MNFTEEMESISPQEPTEEGSVQENYDNASELEQLKHILNEFHAKGNIGQTQIFIQNAGTVCTPHKEKSEEIHSKQTAKTYHLQNPNECSDFVEMYKNSNYLTTAIILSLFSAVPLGDLPTLQNSLMEMLPPSEKDDKSPEGMQDAYASLNTILAVIGGKRFLSEEGTFCLELGESSDQILTNFLEQFPSLRRSIVRWLIQLNETYEYRTGFDAYQMTMAFTKIISFDFADAEKRIFPILYSNSDNAGLLGALGYKLYTTKRSKEAAEATILRWIHSDSSWLWKAACFTYTLCTEDQAAIPFEAPLRHALGKRILSFKRKEFMFTARLLRQSVSFRTLFAKLLYDSCTKPDTEILPFAQMYIHQIQYCYYIVNSSYTELPLVACDTLQQQVHLSPILKYLMGTYPLRRRLYIILQAYLKELSAYRVPVKVEKHISAYFYNLASSNPRYWSDILYLLTNCKNPIATKIISNLQYLRKKESLVSHE